MTSRRQLIQVELVCALFTFALFAFVPIFWGLCGVAIMASLRVMFNWEISLWSVFLWVAGVVSIPAFMFAIFLYLMRNRPERFFPSGEE